MGFISHLIAWTLIIWLTSLPVFGAQPKGPPTPVRKPSLVEPTSLPPVSAVRSPLSRADRAIFLEASRFADRGDWAASRALAAQSTDPVVKRFIEWRYVLSDTSRAPFDEIMDFLLQSPTWPRRDALLARAEKSLPSTMEAGQVIGWFGRRPPASPVGGIRLGQALIASGRREEGVGLVREAWARATFTLDEETQIQQTYAEVLTPTDHKARLLLALAHNDTEAAKRQIRFVDSETQVIARARLELRTSASEAKKISLAPTLQSDIGFRFDQARALRLIGEDEAAWSSLLSIPIDQPGFPGADRTWRDRHIMARDAMKAGRLDVAYRLASQHGLTPGEAFAQAEFLAGWIALRFLNAPDKAVAHFERLVQGVKLPISLARGFYWTGRAHEAMNREGDAALAYRNAAKNPDTFYGQLALTRLNAALNLSVPIAVGLIEAETGLIESDDRFRAVSVLADVGRNGELRSFALHLARELDEPLHFGLLADLLSRVGDSMAALRVAKLASYRRVFLPELTPVIELPRLGSSVEPALVLAIVRQESEFDPNAISAAGARGLMQLMPASARSAANALKIPYRSAALAEAQYNLQLGATHLADYIADFGGSYLLAIAAYNGGPSNVRRWIQTYGDPRRPEIDTIDWIELIPYGETRNYVQRVLETLQVYRNRLAGVSQTLALVSDLERPSTMQTSIGAVEHVLPD